MIEARIVRVFVSAPGDVAAEVEALAGVVEELNLILGALVPERPAVVQLVHYLTHTHPGFGRGPQDVVNQQIGDYDVYLGLMWARFGTPTPAAGSGTEEEFRVAFRGFQERRVPSHVLFYFRGEDPPPDADPAQVERVAAFRAELGAMGLVWSYPTAGAFAGAVRRHLVQVLSEILRAGEQPSRVARQVGAGLPAADRRVVRDRLYELADRYEGIRRALRSGRERTQRMEAVASAMRAQAQAAFVLLPELTGSRSAGLRLAAVCVLEGVPDREHLDWLAERSRAEAPFVAYHAARALLAAARGLPERDLPAVAAALDQTRTAFRTVARDSDRATVLRHAEDELRRRAGEDRPSR